ncbi:MAG TPA: oxygenase MpaB family protein [Solirubrobacteraceae bacterium]|nr:oxygenase MpaB family protein [Solirubrobacteraceae bacterium]
MILPVEAELEQFVLGPESVAWRTTSDVRLNLAMLYPLLLQVAHPTVDAGVSDFSEFEHEPWARVRRTIDYLSAIVYGGRDALSAGRRLRTLHKRFKGTNAKGRRYSALEPEAYAWVHATLLDTFVRANARFCAPMNAAERECFYREYRGLGRLIGVRESDLPPTWPQFCDYFAETAETHLTRTTSVGRVLDALRHLSTPPRPMPEPLWQAIRIPGRRALWLGGVGMMDPWLRRQLEIDWNSLDEVQFRTISILARAAGTVMPTSLKMIGPGRIERSGRLARPGGRALATGPSS